MCSKTSRPIVAVDCFVSYKGFGTLIEPMNIVDGELGSWQGAAQKSLAKLRHGLQNAE